MSTSSPLHETTTAIDPGWSTAVEAVAHAVGEACHAELAGQGVHLPLPHRAAWLAITGRPAWFVSVRDPAGVCRCGFAIEASRSRALPGHRVLRTKRLGPMAAAEPRRRGLAAAVATARKPRVIRYHVEIFCPDQEARREIANDLAAQGELEEVSDDRACTALAAFRRANRNRDFNEWILGSLP